MVGLLNNNLSSNNSTRAITQWRQLFINKNIMRSADAYIHWKNVENLGLPNDKHEDWKYTPLDGLLSHHFISPIIREISTNIRDDLSFTINTAYRLVFVDGMFVQSLSDSYTGLWYIKAENGTACSRALPTPIQSEIFLHLTESLSQQITYIHLKANKIELRPLYLLHISHGSSDESALSTLQYRHHIDIESGAQGQIIEHFTSADTKGHFSSSRTTFAVGNNANLNYTKLVCENCNSYHISHNDIIVGCNSAVSSNTFILGACFNRHQTSMQLNGEGSNIEMNSVLLPSGQEIHDIRTYLEHNKGYCSSRQLHKIIARNCSKGIFNGLIKVAKHALKTDGKMNNSNLLLDRMAEINTKPQLEIYANDVKCSHGATIGQIDEDQIFYLCSRGITRKIAQQMIICAFVIEVVDTIYHKEIRNTILNSINHVLQEN